MTRGERRAALEQIASEVRDCTRCRLHEGRTRAVPGEGDPDTEVVFVGEGPGLQRGPRGPPVRRPGRGPARAAPGRDRLAARGRVHHQRREVPPARQPRPAARRDRGLRPVPAPPARGRWTRPSSSPWAATRWARSCPGPASARSTAPAVPADPETGARDALVFAMYHPAAALRYAGASSARASRTWRASRPCSCGPASVACRARTPPDRPQPGAADRPGDPPDRRRRRRPVDPTASRAHGRRSRGRRRPPAHPVLTPKHDRDDHGRPQHPAPHHPARRGGRDRQEHVRVRVRRRHRRHRLRAHVPRRGDVRHRPRRPGRDLPQGEPRTRSGPS